MSELYELPDGWEWKKLGNITKLQNGFAFKSNLFVNDGLPIVRIKNIQNEKILLDDVVYFNPNDYEKKLDTYQIKKNDLLIAMSGATTGKIGLYNREEKSYLNQRVGLFRIQNSDLRSYLFYFLSTQIEKNLAQSLGAAQPNLSSQQINEMDIPLPPLPEQQRIVSKLDLLFEKIDKSIALHQKNMDEANAFMGSVLNDVFGELEEKYGLTILSTVVKINSGIALPSIFKDKEITDGEYEFFKVAQMNNDKKVMKNADLNFTFLQSKEYKIKLFPKGSILIPKRGGAILTNKKRILERDASYDSNVMGLKANNKILSDEFLFLFLNSIDLADYIDTTTIPQINNKHIDMMNIPIPPIPIQQKTVTYLDEISQKIEKIKQLQKEKMESLKALKASILDSAFRGEL